MASRKKFKNKDDFLTTLSLANADQIFGGDYHGRFLIELLQNAADAWRLGPTPGQTTDITVVIEADEPALVVANRGAVFPADTVLDSLGQIGQSTKPKGFAIGHKGIGFKSVLEVSRAPEIYSGFAGGSAELSIRFDAARALRDIRAELGQAWDDWVHQKRDGSKPDDPRLIPVLRYPVWEPELPAVVTELAFKGNSSEDLDAASADGGYTTIVRLPFTHDVSREEWDATVQRALEDVSDQTLILLGCFDRVVIDDRLNDRRVEICVTFGRTIQLGDGRTRCDVKITREDRATLEANVTSRWVLYRHGTSTAALAGETAVGVRLDRGDERLPVHALTGLAPSGGEAAHSAPFHLYFPTRIGSGLPFLLHGYFEVDAARTGFFAGSAERNREILGQLAQLVAIAVGDLAQRDAVDLLGLVELIAGTKLPEAQLAEDFLTTVLDGLDLVAWVPTAGGEGAPRVAKPVELLVGGRRVNALIPEAFPHSYVVRSTGLSIPDPQLDDASFALLLRRRRDGLRAFWEAMRKLYRPGQESPWADGKEDDGFRALLQLSAALAHVDEREAHNLLRGLRGDALAKLVPVPVPGGGRELHEVPAPGEVADADEPRNRAVTVMARLSEPEASVLVPPDSLNVVFLKDGLLSTEEELDLAKPFGVRPFVVADVIDRLNVLRGDGQVDDSESAKLLTFLWDLLSRQRNSEFSTAKGRSAAEDLAPSRWFWMQPGRGRDPDADRDRQRRERDLSSVRLPTRAGGQWRPAGELAFGEEWAVWMSEHLRDQGRRVQAIKRLSRLAPGDRHLLAPPEQVLGHMSSVPLTSDGTPVEGAQLIAEQLAFLLRLGCWEVFPVEGYEVRSAIAGQTWPWPDTRRSLHAGERPWNFDRYRWGGPHHDNITVTEDFRFRWPLTRATTEAQRDIVSALAEGAELFARLGKASALCPACRPDGYHNHKPPYYTSDDERRESTLALQLLHTAWIPTTRAGQDSGLAKPFEAWWHGDPPEGQAMRTSPFQHLRLAVGADWPLELRTLCRLRSLEDASIERLHGLLGKLGAVIDRPDGVNPNTASHAVDISTSAARQAFIGLHRRIYEELATRSEKAPEAVEGLDVLCEYRGELKYRKPSECRHDDGSQVAFKRRFAAQVPFVVLAPDKAAVARALGVKPFQVEVTRLITDDGTDVTAQLQTELLDRIPEVLAILVHRGSGGATIDPSGREFGERSRRLLALEVRRVANLVLRASVVGFEGTETSIGADSRDETYLDRSRQGPPVLFHDFGGEDWPVRIRSRLAEPVAVLTETPGLADTFRLLLTADQADREDMLRSWGISDSDVGRIRNQIGAVTEQERAQYRHWFAAVLAVAGGRSVLPKDVPDDVHVLEIMLADAGLPADAAQVIARAGAWPEVRDASGPILPRLEAAGLSLKAISEALQGFGEPKLSIGTSKRRFGLWKRAHEQRVVAALVIRGSDVDEARRQVERLRQPVDCEFELNPPADRLLAPVRRLFARYHVKVPGDQLEEAPQHTLAVAAGVSEAELDERALLLFDGGARTARLQSLAELWRRELVHLALVTKAAGLTATSIRAMADVIENQIPRANSPSELRLNGVLAAGYERAAEELQAMMTDDLPGVPPNRHDLVRLLDPEGGLTGASDRIESVRRAPRSRRVETLTRQAARLKEAQVKPDVPPGLAARRPPGEKPARGPRTVVAVKYNPTMDRRKKELGDDAESWATAYVVSVLSELDLDHRRAAINAIVGLMEQHFRPDRPDDPRDPVVTVRTQAELAKDNDLDEEELVDHLQQFVHVAQYSDYWGFDLWGWIPDDDNTGGRPMALEVKSSGGAGFMMSASEWARAEAFSAEGGTPATYAVLVVRRKGTNTPAAMDLLEDPVSLVPDSLTSAVGIYQFTYTESGRKE